KGYRKVQTMAQLKAGTRLRSAVCTTEVMIIAAPAEGVEISCGGVAMIAIDAEPPADVSIDSAAAGGTALGKRYVNEAGDLEILCTKPGEGSLAVAGTALGVKEAKPLPSSD
ncbi:MAG: hypothetical protein ACE5FL_09490, partial [Myxococcota bacterium]